MKKATSGFSIVFSKVAHWKSHRAHACAIVGLMTTELWPLSVCHGTRVTVLGSYHKCANKRPASFHIVYGRAWPDVAIPDLCTCVRLDPASICLLQYTVRLVQKMVTPTIEMYSSRILNVRKSEWLYLSVSSCRCTPSYCTLHTCTSTIFYIIWAIY